MFAPSRAASRMCATADAKLASGSGPMRICTRPTLYLRAFSMVTIILLQISLMLHTARPTPTGGIGLNAMTRIDPTPVGNHLQESAACNAYSSRISTAAAMVVVHRPRLSPTADWVTLLVRTILLEMR